MARKRGKNQQKKKEADVISAALKSVKAKESTCSAEFKLGDGHEDFPYQKGTMKDVGHDFGGEPGVLHSSELTATSTAGGFIGVVVLAILITYGVFLALGQMVG